MMRGGVGAQALAPHASSATARPTRMAGAARKVTGERVPRVSRALRQGPARRSRRRNARRTRARPASRADRDDAGNRVVYFPACATRMFGAPTTEHGLLPTTDAMLALLERAGFDSIVPEHLNGQCCGQPFQSQGLSRRGRSGRRRASSASSSALSEDGALPVVTDASTCAKHMREPTATPRARSAPSSCSARCCRG